MGLFGTKETCCICNANQGKTKISDGYVCKECLYELGRFLPLNKTISKCNQVEFRNAAKRKSENDNLSKIFKSTNEIEKFINFDDENELWHVYNMNKKITPIIYKYSDIIEYELIEDGESITKGGLGRAVAGGLVFGGVGAIVGGVTGGKKTKTLVNNLQIKITIKDINRPVVYVNLITMSVKSSSFLYKYAQDNARKILSTLSVILDNAKEQERVPRDNADISIADELVKMKKLLDDGILSQEEFEKVKEKLLNK